MNLRVGVQRWWAGNGGVLGSLATFVALPLTWGFGRLVWLRNRHFDRTGGTAVEGLTVISIGNLSVGGTGKTPLAAWVARLLADHDIPTALVTRGYGQDEILLHHRWNPDVPVVANPDRVSAARAARERGIHAAVLDDGFQHRRLARHVDVVLVAAEDRFPARLLPAGPFREPVASLGRAHVVVVTRRTAPEERASELAEAIRTRFPRLQVASLDLVAGSWQTLSGNPASAPEGEVMAVAAIARPEAFAEQVARTTGAHTRLEAFPDHYLFTEGDVRTLRSRAGERTVVVTEKDAVKLQPHEELLGPARVLVQQLVWKEGEDALKTLLMSAVRYS